MVRILTPSAVFPKSDEAASSTGQFVLVTATSSASPTTLISVRQLAPGTQFVYVAAALIPGQTASATLTLGVGGTGLGYETEQLIFPKRGMQLVLDWKRMRAPIGAPLVAWASVGSVIVCDVANVRR